MSANFAICRKALWQFGAFRLVLVVFAFIFALSAVPVWAQTTAELETQLSACEARLNEHAEMMQRGKRLEEAYLFAKGRLDTLEPDMSQLREEADQASEHHRRMDDAYQVAYRALKEAEERESKLDKTCLKGDRQACLGLKNLRENVLPIRRRNRQEAWDRAFGALQDMRAAVRNQVEFERKYYTPAKEEFLKAHEAYKLILAMGYGPEGQVEFQHILGECEVLRRRLEEARKQSQKPQGCRSNEHRCGQYCCSRDVACWNRPALAEAIEKGRCR